MQANSPIIVTEHKRKQYDVLLIMKTNSYGCLVFCDMAAWIVMCRS